MNPAHPHNTAIRGSLAALLLLTIAACSTPPRRPPVSPPADRSLPALTPPAVARTRPSDSELLKLSDAIPKPEPRSTLGNPPFYEVMGQRYTVLNDSAGYVERGVASWYGPDFHGQQTSIGEPYDMYTMTAAHKTLPLPAYARVTNLTTGRSIVVRLNDRGPFNANRIIDLSYAAALRLDMVRSGTTLVEVATLQPDGPAPGIPKPSEIYAQVGAFSLETNALKLKDRLVAAGLSGVFVKSETTRGKPLHRVRIGPIESVSAYDALVNQLHALSINQVTLGM